MNNNVLTSYQSLCTQFYDLEFMRCQSKIDAQKKQDLFFMHQARQANGPILEPMCGTGRFMIPLLSAGFDVEGFDASPHMLAAFKQKYAKTSDKPAPITQSFIQNFSSPKRYHLIFIPFGSIGLVTNPADVIKSLANMYTHLAPGGTLILEVDTIASLADTTPHVDIENLKHQENRTTHQRLRGVHTINTEQEIRLLVHESYDPKTQIFYAQCRYELIKNGILEAIENEDFYQYLYDFNQMDELLKNAGFCTIKKYQNYDLEPATDQKTETLLYICTK